MARRDVGEINAGSMADIAFLLLIFFLVTTTMDTDEGIVRMLPQKLPKDYVQPDFELRDRDVFEVLANANDNLLVENEYTTLDKLREKTKEFFTNPNNLPNLPQLEEVTADICNEKINELKAAMAKDPESNSFNVWKSDLKEWETKLLAVKKGGNFKCLPKFAMISLRNDNNTSYELYVGVQNELQGAINELRDEVSMKLYGEKYTTMDAGKPENEEKLTIIRAMVPQRIIEQTPKNIPAY